MEAEHGSNLSPKVGDDLQRSRMRRHVIFSVVALLAALAVAIVYGIYLYESRDKSQPLEGLIKGFLGVVFALWVVIPPVWFLWDWHKFEFKGRKFDKDQFDQFKYSQELARNLWVAVSALLGLLFGFKVSG